MNNIRLGDPQASDDAVIAAAKAAYCDEFVRALPQGYETVLGENGSTLSGGERQRISIARALLKNAPIILLDEATASLDPENEVLVQKALAKLVEGKTVVMIAHRLRTVADADQILVTGKRRTCGAGHPRCADGKTRTLPEIVCHSAGKPRLERVIENERSPSRLRARPAKNFRENPRKSAEKPLTNAHLYSKLIDACKLGHRRCEYETHISAKE